MSGMPNPSHPKRQTRALVLHYTKQGLTPRQVAKLLDVSTQRVYQHLASLRAAGELEEAAS